MPRKAAITPNIHIHTTIDATLANRLELYLTSSLEGKVPKGAYQEFLTHLIRQFFEFKKLDLAPYVNSMPGMFVISGTQEAINIATKLIEKGTE